MRRYGPDLSQSHDSFLSGSESVANTMIKLYVGNLPYSFSDGELQEFFSQ